MMHHLFIQIKLAIQNIELLISCSAVPGGYVWKIDVKRRVQHVPDVPQDAAWDAAGDGAGRHQHAVSENY